MRIRINLTFFCLLLSTVNITEGKINKIIRKSGINFWKRLFARYNLANSILFARLIRQIMTYLLDNLDLEKGEAPLHENFRFLNLKMDSLANKNERLSFSLSSKRLVF